MSREAVAVCDACRKAFVSELETLAERVSRGEVVVERVGEAAWTGEGLRVLARYFAAATKVGGTEFAPTREGPVVRCVPELRELRFCRSGRDLELLREWVAFGERGASSAAIVQWLTGWPVCIGGCEAAYPVDPDDLVRCLMLLEHVPALRREFPRMAELSAEWAALVERWDHLAAILESEVPRWRERPRGATAPGTYAVMRAILDSVRDGAVLG